jgi:hypothetical protein
LAEIGRHKTIYHIAVLTALTLILGLPTLTHRFLDWQTVAKYLLPIVTDAPDLWQQLLFPRNELKFFRPLWGLSMYLDYRIWGTNPVGYHITHLLLHLCSVNLVYFFLRRFFDPLSGLAGAVLFAVHPSSSATFFITDQRGDLLLMVFFSALFLISTRRNTLIHPVMDFLMAIFLFSCALLSKETAVIFPLILVIYYLVIDVQDRSFTLLIRKTGVYWIILLIYLGIRSAFLHGLGGYQDGKSHFLFGLSMWENLGDILCGALGLNTFQPHHSVLRWAMIFFFFAAWAGLKDKRARFGGAWFLISLLLIITIKRFVVLHMSYARFLYLALPGFIMLVMSLKQTLTIAFPGIFRRNFGMTIPFFLCVAGWSFQSYRFIYDIKNGELAMRSYIVNRIHQAYPKLGRNTSVVVFREKTEPFQMFWGTDYPRDIISLGIKLDTQVSISSLNLDLYYPGKNIRLVELEPNQDLSMIKSVRPPYLILEFKNDQFRTIRESGHVEPQRLQSNSKLKSPRLMESL